MEEQVQALRCAQAEIVHAMKYRSGLGKDARGELRTVNRQLGQIEHNLNRRVLRKLQHQAELQGARDVA